MPIRLSYWQSPDGQYARIYANGLDAEAKV
jgi:hypothetical protein